MNFEAARSLLVSHGMGTEKLTFLWCITEGQVPPPGQVTQILVALRIIQTHLRYAAHLDRELVAALYKLAVRAPQIWRSYKGDFLPLMESDLNRITIAVEEIFMVR